MSKKKKKIESIVDKEKIQFTRIMDYNILWFGIDKYGYIFCARTEFTRHVPEFVIRNIEKNEIVNNFFKEFLKTIFIDDDINYLALKGIFYYDLIDEYFAGYTEDNNRIEESKNEFKKHPYHYKKITKNNPTNPLHFDQLPQNIQEILNSQRVKIDAHNTKYFFIPEIYLDASGTINKEARNNKFVCKPMRER